MTEGERLTQCRLSGIIFYHCGGISLRSGTTRSPLFELPGLLRSLPEKSPTDLQQSVVEENLSNWRCK